MCLVVAHVELDLAERVLRARQLNEAAVAPLHALLGEIGRALACQLVLEDRIRHAPVRMRDELENRRPELRRLPVRLADDDVAPVAQARRRANIPA